ncbi:MAG: tRNA (adenosine(37)-N6)-threonylcarbamoyltransferase complex dimerization subunit type 1 TsaB [Pseudomonadota bacterium]
MAILAIDTCANLCAAAVFRDDGSLRSRAVDDIGRGHAARLLGIVDEALLEAKVTLSDIERVLVTIGPGSFTGIRVGVATARGYGVALKIPVEGITTFALLDAQARAEQPGEVETTVAISGGRGQIFTQRISADALPVGPPEIVAVEHIDDVDLAKGSVLVGNAAPLLDPSKANRHLLEDRATGDIAYAFRVAEHHTDAPEPLYIRGADAKPQQSFALPRKSALT